MTDVKMPRKSNVRKKTFNKILTHPDKNDIVRMLTRGQGVRAVAKHLKEKYPKDKSLHVSVPTLQKFRTEKLNLQGEVLSQIKEVEKERTEIKEEKKGEAAMRKLPAYKEAIQKAAEMHLDIRTELSEMITLVKSRIEDLFDRAENGEATINEEANLQKYFPILATSLDKWMKYVEKVADQTVETNINITVIEDQMSVIREAVKETLQDMDPTLALKFMDNLSRKIEQLNYRRQPQLHFETMQKQAQVLHEKVQNQLPEGAQDGELEE